MIYDVCVVGSGAGAGPIIYELSRKGLKVCVLEKGDIYNEKCFEDIEEHVKNGFTEEVKRHTFTLPTLSSKELSGIINSLEEMSNVINNRVVELD